MPGRTIRRMIDSNGFEAEEGVAMFCKLRGISSVI